MTTDSTFETRLRTLADFEPSSWPVLSLYLNTQPNENGRQDFDTWLNRELANKGKTFKSGSDEAKSFEADCGRIEQWLADNCDPATKGVACNSRRRSNKVSFTFRISRTCIHWRA
jgi:hypothetical protein